MKQFPDEEATPVDQIVMPEIELDLRADEEARVHAWRVEKLSELGLARTAAEKFAGLVDWHELAALVERGCPADVALEIVR
jgi:hypothetical protein